MSLSADFERAWLLYEPPVTGGHSLHLRFAEALEMEHTYVNLGRDGFHYNRDHGLSPFVDRPLSSRILARVILGHGVNDSTRESIEYDALHEGCFLRDPIENLAFFFQCPPADFVEWSSIHHDSFATWVASVPENGQARYLCKRLGLPVPEKPEFDYETLVRRLERFQFVGNSENIDAWLTRLFPLMGIEEAPRPGVYEELCPPLVIQAGEDPEFREFVDARDPIDRKLFDYFASKEAERLAWFDRSFAMVEA